MRRSPYTPLQPLPEVEFCPTTTLKIRGVHYSISLPAEVYGQCALVQGIDQDGGVIAGNYIVLNSTTSTVFASFNDLRVARNFAQEMDDLYDWDSLYASWKRSGNAAEARAAAEAIFQRSLHTCREYLPSEKSIFDV